MRSPLALGPAALLRPRLLLACTISILSAGCAAPPAPPIGRWNVETSAVGVAAVPDRDARPIQASFSPSPAPSRSSASSIQRASPGLKIGAPYTVAGITYVPAEDPSYDRIGRASWYGAGFHGRPTANGETYDQDALVAAHPTLPMPSYVLVTNLRNGRTVMLRVNNRGPFKEGRIIDVSRRAAHELGFAAQGLTEVRVRYAGRAPLDGNADREHQHLAAQPWQRPPQPRRTASAATQ